MASDGQLLQDPQWTDANKQWYIASKPVKRILGKNGSAPAGTIFQVDYEHSKLKEKQKKEIILKSCHKGTWKVKWAPGTFYELDDETKDLLLALSDDRLRYYQECQDCLQYGKTLKVGDDVLIRYPKKKEYIIGGEVKYKGPVEDDSSAIWFGVELMGNFGDTDGIFKKTGKRYFTCEQGRGLFVPIKFIIPPWVSGEVKEKLPSSLKAEADASSRSSHAATNAGVSDIPQTPYIRIGDEVILRIQMERGGRPQLVVGHVALIYEDHVAVNVLECETPVYKPWHGFFNGKKIYPEANKQTVWLKLNEVGLTYSPSESASHEDKDSAPYPFTDFVAEVLSEDLQVFKDLVSDLGLSQEWGSINKKEQDNYVRVDFMLKKWWSNIHEKHTDEKNRFLHLLTMHGQSDLRDCIIEVPDFGGFSETVLCALTTLAGDKWKEFATEVGLSPNEVLAQSDRKMTPYRVMQIVFQMWELKDPTSKKLITVIKACRKLGWNEVADDIEQGLSDEVLKKIAGKIERKHWIEFGHQIGVSRVRCHAFDKKFYLLADRVYHMLCWWSMKLPLQSDKAELLSLALNGSNLRNIAAEELSRGIEDNELKRAAHLISDCWIHVAAALQMSPRDVEHLKLHEPKVKRAELMLNMWKRRQPLSAKNLKEALYLHLIDIEMYRAARLLYDGLDNGTVTCLSRKLCFDWPALAHHFGYSHDEISRCLATTHHMDMSLVVLKEWLFANREESSEKTKTKLMDGLVAIGREDLVNWLEKRVEEDVEEKLKKGYVEEKSEKSTGGALQTRKLDRILMEDVASAVSHHVDAANFKSILNLQRDVQKYLPKSVRLNDVQPHFAILCSWKKKQLSEGREESECFKLLKDILTHYEQHTAAAVLNIDGSPVDPDGFSRAEGTAAAPVHQDLNVCSMVEVSWGGTVMPGVIQWIGVMKGLEEHGKIAGIELEDFAEVGATAGKFGDVKYFSCQFGKGLFLPLSRCRPDSRFLTETETFMQEEKMDKEDFGNIECKPVKGYVHPPETVQAEHIGMFKGIQGHHNSCYMDVTLYSMFAFSDIFDAILHYTDTAKPETMKVKDALRETIVNPLRSLGVVRADHVLRFRDLLSCLSSMEGFRTEEKDPEEFIHALLQELVDIKPFLKIRKGVNDTMESFVYEVTTDKKKYLDIPTVEDLLHVSFLESDLKLCEVPKCLIVKLPRHQTDKPYDWIIPSLEMDISSLLTDSPRPCNVCGKLAAMECQDCTPKYEDDDIIQSFCVDCFYRMHRSKKQHECNPLTISKTFINNYMDIATAVEEDRISMETNHLYEKRVMELFSVVCVETSHYVAFVKAGSGRQAEWVFFDSMADRGGDQHGYNVPEVTHLRDFEAQMRRYYLKDAVKGHGKLPSYVKRLLSGAYICFYFPAKLGGRSSCSGSKKRSTGGSDQTVASSDVQ